MAIEKLDFQKVTKEKTPYTVILNSVIQNIKNLDALAIWVYLYTLPENWDVNKEHLKNKFKIGNKKLKQVFSYLSRANLCHYDRERYTDGTLGKVLICIRNGDNFDKNVEFIDVSTTGSESDPVVISTTGSKNHPVVIHPTGSGLLQKKQITKEIKDTKKRESACSLSVDFYPDQETFNFLAHKDISQEVAKHTLEKFIEYYAGGDILKSDWQREFRLWILRERKN